MQKNNYFQSSQETLVTNNILTNNGGKSTQSTTGSLYANFIKTQQQQKQSGLKDMQLKQYLLTQKNLDPKKSREIQVPLNRPSTNSKSNTSFHKPQIQIERISISFKKQLINKQQQIQDDVNQSMEKLVLDDPTKKLIVTLQSLCRKRIQVKAYQQLVKKQKYRRSIVNELLTTEKQYLADLNILSQIQKQLKLMSQYDDKIIGTKDIKYIFQNLDDIIGLSEQILESLTIIQLDFSWTTKIGDQMKTFALFFKLYLEYCNNYVLSTKLITKLKKDDLKFKDFLSNIEKTLLKGCPFDGYLIRPVQRVPKYVLLLKDLLKNTSQNHCDFSNIQQALDMFIKVNEDNNKHMDKYITNQKIFELEKLFGSTQVTIVDAKREFKSEESLKIFYNHEARPVIVYFLTDLLLVTEREEKDQKSNYKLLKYIYLDQYSSGQELDDSAHISFLFRLVGKNETVTFIADNKENKQKFIDYINELINGIKINHAGRQRAYDKHATKIKTQVNPVKHPVIIKVLGTQEVYETSVKTYTQYIIEVEIADIVQKIFLRFSHFLEIQKQIQQEFPKLKLPYFKDSKWLGNHDVKVIEGRKIQIMNFLQTLLSMDEMLSDGQEILKQLGLPSNFYLLPEMLECQTKENAESLTTLRLKKKPQSVYSQDSSRTSSVFQSYFNTDTYKNDMKSSGNGGGVLNPQLVFGQTARVPVKAQHIYEYSPNEQISAQSSKEKLSKFQSQKEDSQQLLQQLKQNSSNQGSRSNSQQKRKYSATKVARGSVPMISTGSVSGSVIQQKEQNFVTIKVQILTFPKPTEIEIQILPSTRGTDAFEDVLLQINLQTAFDFKLYIQEKHGQRPIEDDELLWTLLVEQLMVQSTTQKITQLVKRVTTNNNSYNLKPVILKKHLYLPEENERESYEDPKRVELLAQQSFMDITSNQLKLNDTEYIMFTALKLYLDGVKNIQLDKIPVDKIQEFLPLSVFKSIPRENWQFILPNMLKSFEDEVRGIFSEYDTSKNTDGQPSNAEGQAGHPNMENEVLDSNNIEYGTYKHSRQLTSSDCGDEYENNRLTIGQMVFLKLISQTQFYGLKIFELSPDKETRINLQKLCDDQFKIYLTKMGKSAQNQQPPQITSSKLLMCIGFSSINIYSNYKENRPLICLNHCDINQVKAHPLSLLIQLLPVTDQNGASFQVKKYISLHFETIQSFVIQMLIQEYQEVRQTLDEESGFTQQIC